MRPWILHIVLAWSIGPLAPEEQKTILLNFGNERECTSIARQVDDQVKAARAAFRLKTIACFRCEDVYSKAQCAVAATKKR